MPQSPAYDKFVKGVAAFSDQIKRHSLKSWNGIDFSNTEPEIIKKYLLEKKVGVDYLNKHVAPILSFATYQVKFASVFIHQKPRITRHPTSVTHCTGDTPSCELGDLMVVLCLLDKNKTPLFTSAVIAQAKKERTLTSRSQQCLYDSDIKLILPDRVASHSVIPSPERSLPDYSQGRSKALHYLILDRHPSLRQVPWDSNMEYGWEHFIHRILVGDLGLPFRGIDGPDWNCIMHDLLNIGNGIIPSRINRGNGLSELVNVFNDFNEYDKYSLEIEDAQGLPMMFIIVRDTEYIE